MMMLFVVVVGCCVFDKEDVQYSWRWRSVLSDRRLSLFVQAAKATILSAAIAGISLPAWSGDPPSLQDLIKGTAPPLKVDDKETSLQGQVDTSVTTPLPLPVVLPAETAATAPEPPAPIKSKRKKPLEASIQTREMQSSAEQEGDNLQGQSAAMDKNKSLNGNANDLNSGLSGGLNSQDPDVDDQEMMVEWDKWHNRVLNAIQQGLIEQLQSTGDNVMFYDPRTGRMRSKYPLGTMAMFSCQVTPDHHIINLKIEQPSGYTDYDRAVYQAVKVLEGSSILRYPKNSHRKVVFEAAGIRTSMQSGPANFHWGDTEHYRVPGNR